MNRRKLLGLLSAAPVAAVLPKTAEENVSEFVKDLPLAEGATMTYPPGWITYMAEASEQLTRQFSNTTCTPYLLGVKKISNGKEFVDYDSPEGEAIRRSFTEQT